MGNCTFTLDISGYSPKDAASGWEARGTVTLSNNYATGGDVITAAQLGLGIITKLSVASAGGYVFRYNSGNGTIQAYWSSAAGNPLSEVTATTNLSAITTDIVAQGP